MFAKNENEIYIIAEIGQNHNGDIEICKKLIDQLVVYSYDEITGNRLNTINAIKLTKRDLDEELSNDGMKSEYTGKNSFGKSYGEHRDFLEFSYEEHCELSDYIRDKGVGFVDTLCSPKTVKLTEMTTIDKVKIASRDITNIPLLKEIAKIKNDVIISTGMSGLEEIDFALNILGVGNRNISILHCLSQYPAEYSRLNLLSIKKLQEMYGDKCTIGYSDHSIGDLACISAVAMGAQIIEKHFTLDKTHQFGDHPLSADLNDMKKLVSDVRRIEEMRGAYGKKCQPSESESKKQLRRSLHISVDIKKGSVIDVDMLIPLVSGEGMAANRIDDVVGKTVIRDIKKGEPVSLSVLK